MAAAEQTPEEDGSTMSTFGCCAAFHTSSASAADDTSRSMARVTIAATREETKRSDVGKASGHDLLGG